VFWGDAAIFDSNPVTIDIILPTGYWVLASAPVKGWKLFESQDQVLPYVLFGSIILISLLIWLLAKAWVKISTNEAKLKALFGSMHDIVIEFDNKYVYRNIAPTNEGLLIRPSHELVGKSVFEVFNQDFANELKEKINKCFKTKEVVNIDYPLMISGEKKWFSARISYISDKRVVFVAHDFTEKKNATVELQKSAQNLKELNAMKDKFFSIIAHDLKNPLGTYMQLTDLIFTDYDEIPDAEKKSILEQLMQSSKTIYNLLENLLEWSRSQRGILPFNPEMNDLNFVAENVCSVLHLNAQSKNLSIENKVDEYTLAYFDANMIITVIRNLVSNAIKFTHEGGFIVIDNKYESDMKFITVSVTDSGIGMSASLVEKLFRLDESVTSPGTNNEQGTGLGLILCKEFINKNGGDIWVESKDGEGSTFYFTLPLHTENE
jgi:PAS domain S-box-containing protein